MVTILLQKILDLLKENLSNMIKFFVTDPQDGQTLVYDAESEEWKNDFIEIELQESASGSVATFNTDATLPLVSLKANITAQQAGSGTPSPQNIRNISGYSSVELTQKDSDNTTVDTITIALGDTYYCGVIDVKNGTATITHIKETLRWSEGTAVSNLGTYTRKMFVSSTMANESLVQLCNVAPYLYNYSSDSLHFYCRAYSTDTRIYLFLDPNNLPEGFDEFEVIYGLATPITLSGLTPDNFTTIQGENNISANSGDVEVIYNTTSAQKVWDISNHVKDLTANLTIDFETIEESSCDVRAYQQGHLVYVQIQNLKYLFMPEETDVIITGLPKPKLATNVAVADGYDLSAASDLESIRMASCSSGTAGRQAIM